MKTFLLLPAIALLAACQSSPLASLESNPVSRYWYGSRLDAIGARPTPPLALDTGEAQQLTADITRIHAEAASIRVQLAQETDRVKRFADMRRLRELGDEARPKEQRLRDAGLPVPAAPPAN